MPLKTMPLKSVLIMLAAILMWSTSTLTSAQAQAKYRFDESDLAHPLRVKKGATFEIQLTVAPTLAQSFTLKQTSRKVKLLKDETDYKYPKDKKTLTRLGCCMMLQTWTFSANETGNETIVFIENYQDRISEYAFQILIE